MANPLVSLMQSQDGGSQARLVNLLTSLTEIVKHGEINQVGAFLGMNNLAVSPVSSFPSLQIPDDQLLAIRPLLERSLRRQERMYRRVLGIKLTKNPDYQIFREKLILPAIASYKKGMKYFGIVLGDDILGPGNGISPMRALSILKEKGDLIESSLRTPKVSPSDVLVSVDEPVTVSYGFWSYDTSEPDKGLVSLPGQKLASRKVLTQGCLEHLLFILEHCLRKKSVPNMVHTTLCPLTSFKDGAYFVQFGAEVGKVRMGFSFSGARINTNSHRQMMRVEVPSE